MEFKKITEDMVYDLEMQKVIGELPTSIQEYIENEVRDFKFQLLCNVAECESPIEMMMSMALDKCWLRGNEFNIEIMEILKQENIKCGDNIYIADFVIVAHNTNTHDLVNFVVECDGHDFHQKTKKQVERDNMRNRNMALNGYPIIRFSGSEIYDHSYLCARETFKYIDMYMSKRGVV